MTPELKSNWVAALRSGKYTQGQTYLRSKTDKYCCLGVLADLCGEKWDTISPNTYGFYEVLPEYSRYTAITVFSFQYAKRVGLPQGVLSTLISMNDQGVPFDRIATYIERTL